MPVKGGWRNLGLKAQIKGGESVISQLAIGLFVGGVLGLTINIDPAIGINWFALIPFLTGLLIVAVVITESKEGENNG